MNDDPRLTQAGPPPDVLPPDVSRPEEEGSATSPAPTEAAPEPAPSPPPADSPQASAAPDASRLSRALAFLRGDRRVAALALATAVLSIGVLLLGLMVFAPGVAPIKTGVISQAQQQEQVRDVREVAERFAEALYTFNYQSIDEDIGRIRADATGGFEQELQRVLGDVETYRNAIVEAQAVSSGRVQGTDVRSVSDNSASARVFVLRTIQNRESPEGRSSFDAVELTLVRTPDGWKVDNVRQFRPEEDG